MAQVRRSHLTTYSRSLAQPQARYLVLIVLDGGRPDYFGLTSLPHVDALRRSGVQYTQAIDGILESETPAGHATIATGSSPVHDGILGFSWAQNDNDYSLFSPQVVRAGTIEHIMQSAHVPTIAGLYKAHYPGAKVVALSGHKYYAADPLGGPAADAIMYYQGGPHGRYFPVAIPGHVPPPGVLNAPGLVYPTTHLPDGVEDNLATRLALAAVRKMHPRLLLINYPEIDWPLGHVDGGITDRAKVITDMRGFDRDLGLIEDTYRRLGILQQTLFVITADHGMDPLWHFVPDSLITNAVARAGAKAPSIAYSTAAYVWLDSAKKAGIVARNIDAANSNDIQSVYYLSMRGGKPHYNLASRNALGTAENVANHYLLRKLLNGHEPNVVVFARGHRSFADPKTHWKADHGGDDWQSQHVPLIFAGPGIRHGVVVNQPAQLEDVAPTLLTDMGVNPTGMHGHVLTEALQSPPAANVAPRGQEIQQLTPLVHALVAQDSYDARH